MDVDDLVSLTQLNEEAVLEILVKRFTARKIYTFTGPVLLAINPFRQIPSLYSLDQIYKYQNSVAPASLGPHVFAVAQAAYLGMTQHGKSQTILISGESGAGKSVSVHAVSGLLPSTARITGSIEFEGNEILGADQESLRKLRAEKIGVIFQDPLTSLDPCFKVGAQIAEIFQIHRGLSKDEAWNQAVSLLDSVQIPDPERRANQFPHQLSGGQRQRVMIAMAIALEPKLLIADEPTTALDASVQVAVLELIQRLRDQRDMAVVLITHNIGVAAAIADLIAIMYAGRIVETGTAQEVLR